MSPILKFGSGLVCIFLASVCIVVTYIVSTRSHISIPITYTMGSNLRRMSNMFQKTQCGLCNKVDLNANVTEDYPCVQMKFEPPTQVCLYPEEMDIYVSYLLNRTGMWEPKLVTQFQTWMKEYPTSGLIDIGTNIGVFSLLAASMGRYVLSVEPNIDNMKRFQKGVQMGRLENKVTLLSNAIADKPGVAKIIRNKYNNQGSTQMEFLNDTHFRDPKYDDVNLYTKFIVLNDFVPFCQFTDAIMKIDIEGFEHQAFVQADLLFDTIVIHKVLMEWVLMRSPASPRDESLVIKMVDFLIRRDYIPKDWDNVPLNHSLWREWPIDVVWHKMNVSS